MSLLHSRSRLLASVALLLISAGAARADIPVSIYGDFDYKLQNDNGTTSNFSAPRFELFYQGSYDRLSFLSEVLLEADNNAYGIDIERVQATYTIADWMRITAGRFHTSIGYYNDAFHHGFYFVLPTERPTMVDFEDSNGLIPNHLVGLQFDGRFHLSENLALRYDAEIGNGRGTPGEVTIQFARKTQPAVNFRLRLEPGGFLDGLILGGSIYLDKLAAIPADPTTTPPTPAVIPYAMQEILVGAHAAYFENNIHFVAEYVWIQHTEQDGGTKTYKTQAMFAEAGYTFADAWTPYGRYEFTKLDSTNVDPYFAAEGVADSGHALPLLLGPDRGSYHRGSVGIRYLINEHLALKLEGSLQHFFDPASAGRAFVYSGKTQLAYAF